MRIELPGNLNRKLGCDYIVHIMPASKKGVSEKSFGVPVEVAFRDTVVSYVLYDYCKDVIRNIPAHLIALSHGMDRDMFEGFMFRKHGLMPEREAGIYFFKRFAG